MDSKTRFEKPGPERNDAGAAKWLLIVLSGCAFHLSYTFAGAEKGLWVPAVGLGMALTAWTGYLILPFVALDALVVNWTVYPGDGALRILLDSTFLTANVGLGWWVYQRWAGGSRQLDDPRSATLFLIVVPGLVQGLLACLQALVWKWTDPFNTTEWAHAAGSIWISHALGSLIPVPVLLVVVSPWLLRHRWLNPDPPRHKPGGSLPQDWTTGEIIETAGLTLGNSIFAIVLVLTRRQEPNFVLWGIALLVVVWASLRQGLRGGTLTAGIGASLALTLAVIKEFTAADFSPLQGNLLAQCSTALLVGASSGWIRASEARYRQVVGHIPVVLYSSHLPRSLKVEPHRTGKANRPDSDPDLATGPNVMEQAEITLVSLACRQIFNCEPEELMGPYPEWLARIHPDDRELVLAAISQLCRQKEPVSCEYRLDPSTGKPPDKQSSPSWATMEHFRWVRDTMTAYHTPDGLLAGWEGVVEDITEQQALSLKLKRTSNMLQALITNLPAGVFFVQGALGQPILVNARARQLLGQREDRAAGIAYLSQVYRLHRADGTLYPADQLPVALALRQGTTHMVNDIVIHHPDGRRVPLITWAAPVDLTGNGKPDAAVWVMEDMTSLQNAERARRESENRLRQTMEVLGQSKEKYQNLVETLPLMVLQLDADGKIIFLNTAVERISGFTAAELSNPGFWESLLEEDDRQQFQTARMRTLSGYHARVEFRFTAKDGSVKVGHALMQPMVQENRVSGTTCLVVDMTLQRFLESELQKAQQLELVGRLASGTVHDFNNLVTVMVGLAGLAKLQIDPAHPAQEPLDRMHEVGEQASHLIGQILAFSKQRHTDATTVDLNAVVRHCLKILRGVVPMSIAIETALAEEELLAQGDETQFKQIVINLCLNAREAMPDGGRLLVKTDVIANPTDRRMIRLSVQDTGQGMSETVLARIFEPFFSTKERGTGLGLTVVRQIVESFGGRIQAWSQPLQGTRIEILFKEAEGKAAKGEA